MARSERLLALLQRLRVHRRPVSAARLADEMHVSVRTIYRDIQSLVGQGAPVEGEAGVGYVLEPGFTLPPLMFGRDEADALLLGSRWVARHGDPALAESARNAMAKIRAVVPSQLRAELDASGLVAGGGTDPAAGTIDVALVRKAIQTERKLAIAYRDATGATTRRIIWPVALAIFDRVQLVAAWCELREGFRHFRTDRITAAECLAQRMPRRHASLLKEWRRIEGVPEPA